MRVLVALFAGGLFGLGLIVSDMVNPARVLGFLDVAGAWDPIPESSATLRDIVYIP